MKLIVSFNELKKFLFTYKWQAINLQGQIVSGITKANTKNTLKKHLIKNHLTPLQIKIKINLAWTIKSIATKQQQNFLIRFSQHIATLLNGGLPLLVAITLLQQTIQKPKFKKILQQIIASLKQGEPFCEALHAHNFLFTDFYCALIRAGEESGNLALIMQQAAKHLTQMQTLRRELHKAGIYPLFIFVVSLLVTLFLLFYALPQFEGIYESFNAKLPFITQWVITFAQYTAKNSLFLLCIFSILSGSLFLLWQKAKRKIPFISYFFYLHAITLWITLLNTLLLSGIALLPAIVHTNQAITDKVLQNKLNTLPQKIAKGYSLVECLENTQLFSQDILMMIKIGETSGSLTMMLEKIKKIYHTRLNALTSNIIRWFEPLIMLVLGILIGGLIIALYLPIFKLGTLL